MHRSTRRAWRLSWVALGTVSVLAWRRLPPFPYGDPTGLFLAVLFSATALLLLGWWLSRREQGGDR